VYPKQMNIGNKMYQYPRKGFMSTIAPYATASSGAALGFIIGGPAGAVVGGKLGYELGQGNTEKFIGDSVGLATGGLVSTNKRKRE